MSEDFQAIAGELLYKRVTISGDPVKGSKRKVIESVFLGADGLHPVDPPKGKSKAEAKKGEEEVKADTPTPFAPKLARNFKLPLLKHVKILTIADHHSSTCEPISHHVAQYCPNLEVLRIVPLRQDTVNSARGLCTGDQPCPLTKSINPKHVVFRNIGKDGIVFDRGAFKWKATKLQTITYVFTPDARAHGYRRQYEHDMRVMPKAQKIRIVYSDDEGESRKVGMYELWSEGMMLEDVFSHDYENFEETIWNAVCQREDVTLEICGGEVIQVKEPNGMDYITPRGEWVKRAIKRVEKENTKVKAVSMTRKEWKATPEAVWEMNEEEAMEDDYWDHMMETHEEEEADSVD
jgi:hypothetical protein